MTSSPVPTWGAISNELAAAAEQVGKSVMTVHGRHRFGASGIQWREGVLVTAEHAVRRADEIKVRVGPEDFLDARLAGRDSSTDLAVLKIDKGARLPTAPVEQSTNVKLGQIVLALARSRRGDLVASAGIIGGLSGELRTWRGGRLDQHIRLALELYPGFSGGPLVSALGKVIGINTSGLSRGRAITVPVSTVNRVVDELLEKGHIMQPYLGLAMQPVDIPESFGSKMKTPATRGLLIVHVEPGGPAAQSGALIGDVLVALRDEALHDTESLHEILLGCRIGERLATTILRGGSPLSLPITVGERPQQ